MHRNRTIHPLICIFISSSYVLHNAAYQTQVKSLPRLVLTWPSDASHIEPAGVVGLEERFHYSPLLLAFPADGAEQVLGIHLIPHPLETGDADQRQQNRYDEEVPWVTTHKEAQAVEGRMKGLVHPRQPTAHIELQKKTQSELQSPIRAGIPVMPEFCLKMREVWVRDRSFEDSTVPISGNR